MVEPRDITARLLDRAKEDRQCAENNKAVFDAFAEQMRLFENREGHNVYAVRMAVDHKNGMERDARYAADLEEAAAEIQRLRAEVDELTSERTAERLAYAGMMAFNGHSMHMDHATKHMKRELEAIRAEVSKGP